MLNDAVSGFRAETMALTLKWRAHQSDAGHVMAFTQAVGQ